MSNSTSLIRALDVLTFLSGHPNGVTIVEIVEALDQPRSNVTRIVNTLIQYGLIGRTNGRRLRPTKSFYDLCTPDRYSHLRQRYRPVLAHLAEELGELVLLGVQEGNAIVHIDHIDSDQRIRVAPSPTTRHDLRRNAIGKISLSRRPDLMADIDDPEFAAEIATVQRTGIAWNREETTEGVIVMACPGFTNSPTEPIIAVAWPKFRFSEESAKKAHKTVLKCLAQYAR